MNTLYIVGLGPGAPDQLTLEASQRLLGAPAVLMRTAHPLCGSFEGGRKWGSFDHLYDSAGSFDEVYQEIARQVLGHAACADGLVYAVPGDPMVGESTVGLILAQAPGIPVQVRIVHGISFVEPCLAAAGLDALDGVYVADALELARQHHPPFPPDKLALVGQLHSRLVAADVKLTLMNTYPAEHPVHLIHGAGTDDCRVEAVLLHEIDRAHGIGAWSALLVPGLRTGSSFESFQETVAHLRAPEGCPWDREQTHESLRAHLMEEAYEALQAIDEGDEDALREELGDLLLQIVLQSQIAVEGGTFTMAQVIAGIDEKIHRRHPHVFGDVEAGEVDQVLRNWEALKAVERLNNGQDKGLLDGVPSSLPALAQAAEVQGRVARVGFDWPSAAGAREKVLEELAELDRAEVERQADELGDLLFAVVNYARRLDVDPEAALRTAISRFRRRFAAMESASGARGKPLADMSLEEMDRLWEQAKQSGL